MLGLTAEERKKLTDLTAPAVRLAVGVGPVESFIKGLKPYPQSENGDETRPALLVSFVYLEAFMKYRHRYAFRDWVMDSGAFSAHNSGTEIKLQDYIDCCKQLLETDSQLTEVYALDVIGDWRASLKNCEEMWKQGVPAIPCFHGGEPWHALDEMARQYPKIAIGGVARTRGAQKIVFAEQVFARVWPKKIHGFGFGSEKQLMAVPFHSVDSCNWEIGVCGFGSWNYFGNMSVRGSSQNLRVEVEWYLKLEKKARWKWRKEMELLSKLPDIKPDIAGKSETLSEEAERLRGKKEKTKADFARLAKLVASNSPKAKTIQELRKKKVPGRRGDYELTPSVRLACCMSDGLGGNWGVKSMDRALGKHIYGETFEPNEWDKKINRRKSIVT